MELTDLLIQWLKEEFKTAKHLIDNPGEYQTHIFRIDKAISYKPLQTRYCCEIKIADIGSGLGYITLISKNCLKENIDIGFDDVKFGRWGKDTRLEAADPDFFAYMTYWLSWVMQVITMGDFSPSHHMRSHISINRFERRRNKAKARMELSWKS